MNRADVEADPGTARLAEHVRAGLPDADWDELYRWFRRGKLKAILTTNLDSIDLTDLPSVEGGRMAGFVDVFPRGLALDFRFEAGLWVADDQSCVQLECKCRDAILSFVQYEDDPGRVLVQQPVFPQVRYDYRTEAVSEAKPGVEGMPAPALLLAALKSAPPNLDMQLEMRHPILQHIYRRELIALKEGRLPGSSARWAPVRVTGFGLNLAGWGRVSGRGFAPGPNRPDETTLALAAAARSARNAEDVEAGGLIRGRPLAGRFTG